MKNSFIKSALVGMALALSAGTASAVVTTQLGGTLDASGSVSTADWILSRQGWADAVATIPVDGSVELTIVRFASTASVVIGPTIVDSLATRANLVTQLENLSKSGNGGSTDIAAGITTLANAMVGSANWNGGATDSFMNISSDGGSNATAAANAAKAAQAAGIDASTAEAIGPGAATGTLLRTVFNGSCAADTGCGTLLATDSLPPNPLNTAWVLPTSDFEAFGDALKQKVGVIVGVPVPAPLALLAIGLFGIGMFSRKARAA